MPPMHRRMLAPINSVKHYIQHPEADVTAGTVSNMTVAAAISTTANKVNTSDVEEGSIIKAIFIELWLNGREAANTAQFTVCFYKQQGGTNAMSATDLAAIQSYDNKKNIIFTSQGLLGEDVAQSVPILRQWFKIPKGKQRMGAGDIWKLALLPTNGVVGRCGFNTYKEYL